MAAQASTAPLRPARREAAARQPRRVLATSAIACAASAALLCGASAFVGVRPATTGRNLRAPLRAGAPATEAVVERDAEQKQGLQWRLNLGRAIDVLRRDTRALFDGSLGDNGATALDLSIYSEDIQIVDARLPSFELKGLATYERILSTMHWSLKTACEQSKMEITSVTPPVNNEVYMRWKLFIWPRDLLSDARSFLTSLGAPTDTGVPGMPLIFEGYSRYEFDPWTAEITKHTIDITNPPMFLSDLIQQYTPSTAWMTPATHGLGVPMRYGAAAVIPPTADTAPQESQSLGGLFAGGAAPSAAIGASGASESSQGRRATRRAGWAMPQSCEDDFECNDGKANFPLQCCEMPLIGNFCCEPDDFERAPETPAYVPLPVPVNEWDKRQ